MHSATDPQRPSAKKRFARQANNTPTFDLGPDDYVPRLDYAGQRAKDLRRAALGVAPDTPTPEFDLGPDDRDPEEIRRQQLLSRLIPFPPRGRIY